MNLSVQSSDGHLLTLYVARPGTTPRGVVVVLQEIFGVNSHIRKVADTYAQEGYLAIAPALFDRVDRGYEAGYTQEDVVSGVERMKQLNFDNALLDVQAALSLAPPDTRSAVVGFCFGGTVAWLAAARLPSLAAAVCYYGGGIPGFVGEKPQCSTLLHFGEMDVSLPADKARHVAALHPQAESHFYDAGHGFNCDQRGSFDSAAASLAMERTKFFLHTHIGTR